MKLLSADGSVGSPHVRVGHRQALIPKNPNRNVRVFFCLLFLSHLRQVFFRNLSLDKDTIYLCSFTIV